MTVSMAPGGHQYRCDAAEVVGTAGIRRANAQLSHRFLSVLAFPHGVPFVGGAWVELPCLPPGSLQTIGLRTLRPGAAVGSVDYRLCGPPASPTPGPGSGSCRPLAAASVAATALAHDPNTRT
jgi:hypothetical protein